VTVTGAAYEAQERGRDYGSVLVTVTVTSGKVTAVSGVENATDNESQQISGGAIPTLNREALAAQSAQIDAVSGATITSGAYVRSLQSALDKAKA
jgi:uncharacterized protein with FMN-binding domain